MLTRLWTGALLIVIGVGILLIDAWLAPWYLILLFSGLAATLLATRELVGLLPEPGARNWLVYVCVSLVFLANWPAHVGAGGEAWHWIGLSAVGSLLALFLIEAAYFQQAGSATQRIAHGWFIVGYVGVLASFLIQLRWLPGGMGGLALALAMFVPKSCDIGAYFTGRAIGRHPFSPILSPKKTWEGAVGGLVAAVLVSLGVNALAEYGEHGRTLMRWESAALFGLVVGFVGMLGDLMESLLKRDSGKKDAANFIPSFGGMLDVLDSILFSAPVSYVWLAVAGGW